MATFSVLLLTAVPPGHAGDGVGAYVKIDARECLLRSVELFLNRDEVKQIQLVVATDRIDEAKKKFGPHLGFSGVKILPGGPRWADQLSAAVEKIDAGVTHVIVHDAARPVVAYTDLDALFAAAAKSDATALVAPIRQTLLELDATGVAQAQRSPDRFLQLLTPQAYSRKKFDEMARTRTEPHPSQLTLVQGSPLNVRVAGAGDSSFAKAMLAMLPKPKTKPSGSPFEEAQW